MKSAIESNSPSAKAAQLGADPACAMDRTGAASATVAGPLETSRMAHGAVIAVALVLPSLITWAYFVAFAGHPLMKPIYAIGKVAQFALPLAWVVLVQRRRVWPARPSWRCVGIGVLFGLSVLAAMLVVHRGLIAPTTLGQTLAAEVQLKLDEIGIAGPGWFLALAAYYSLVHSLLEEYYWRWFVFGQSRRVLPYWVALVGSALGFMAHHVLVVAVYLEGQWLLIALASLAVAVGGAFWAWLYNRSGSLYGPWVSHLLVDAGLMLIGYQMIWGA